jgi:hypothetical protein
VAVVFKVQARSVEEYFRFDPGREDDLRALDSLIRAAAPALARWFVAGTSAGEPGMTLSMIGYGQYQYTVKASPAPVTWPILGLALQKNYISLYNSAHGNGPPFTCAYAERLGRARVSKKGVVTFRALQDMNLQALTEMITAIEAGLAAGQLTAR